MVTSIITSIFVIPTQTQLPKVTALGRLEPEAEITKLSTPLTLDGDRI